MKKPTLVAVIIAFVAGLGAAVAYRMYTEEVPSLADEAAAVSLSADQLLADYAADEAQANQQYLDQVLQVNGTVKEAPVQRDSTTVVLLGDPAQMAGVSCAFGAGVAAEAAQLQPGDAITVKGLCTGSLLDVNLARCVLVRQSSL
jgi:hypothetical protein